MAMLSRESDAARRDDRIGVIRRHVKRAAAQVQVGEDVELHCREDGSPRRDRCVLPERKAGAKANGYAFRRRGAERWAAALLRDETNAACLNVDSAASRSHAGDSIATQAAGDTPSSWLAVDSVVANVARSASASSRSAAGTSATTKPSSSGMNSPQNYGVRQESSLSTDRRGATAMLAFDSTSATNHRVGRPRRRPVSPPLSEREVMKIASSAMRATGRQ